jgi:hypothetical protein
MSLKGPFGAFDNWSLIAVYGTKNQLSAGNACVAECEEERQVPGQVPEDTACRQLLAADGSLSGVVRLPDGVAEG